MRGCAPACTCGDVSGAQCNGTVSVSPPDSGCGGVATKYPVPFTCQGVREIGDFLLTLSASGGSCAPPTQAAPSGSAAPHGPLTFCCTP
jgi:hypothetical protein